MTRPDTDYSHGANHGHPPTLTRPSTSGRAGAWHETMHGLCNMIGHVPQTPNACLGTVGGAGLLASRFSCSSLDSVSHSATFLSLTRVSIDRQKLWAILLTHSSTHSRFQLQCSTSPYMGWFRRGWRAGQPEAW